MTDTDRAEEMAAEDTDIPFALTRRQLARRDAEVEARVWDKAFRAQCEFCSDAGEYGDGPELLKWYGVARWWHKRENCLCQADDLRKAKEAEGRK